MSSSAIQDQDNQDRAEVRRLSRLVLDQSHSLKEAYDKIRKLTGELADLHGELERVATFDPLSGLLNRRTLFVRLEQETERAARLNLPLAGLMLDIDKFKSINDTYGHRCGDIVLREVGARLSGGLRKYDYAGRYGGEEFLIVLSNTTASQALSIGERFRTNIENTPVILGSSPLRVTVSVGASVYQPPESCESWINRIDGALYRAKQTGRNRVVGA